MNRVGTGDTVTVILDSGADMSLLPRRYADKGIAIDTPNIVLEDAQGGVLEIGGMRRAELYVKQSSSQSGCVICENFVLSDVSDILLSMGRLTRHGWTFSSIHDGGEYAGILASPDGKFRFPVYYRRNSLVFHANVRKVSLSQPVADSAQSYMARAIKVTLDFNSDSLVQGWQFLVNATPVHKYVGRNFVDPRGSFSTGVWKYRTTVCRNDDHWELVDMDEQLEEGRDLQMKIPGLLRDTIILTFLQRKKCDLSKCLLSLIDEEPPQEGGQSASGGGAAEQGGDVFPHEALVPMEVQGEVHPLVREETGGGLDPVFDSVHVDGQELWSTSPIRDLQHACHHLGISTSGTKQKLFERICGYFSRKSIDDVDEITGRLRQGLEGPQANVRHGVREPTDDERRRHDALHLPFAEWCEVCVQTKGKEDHSPPSADFVQEPTDKPQIQMDYFYLSQNQPALALLDVWSRYGRVLPVQSKGAFKHVAEAAVRFLLELNYLHDEVVYVMDVERATVSLLEMIVKTRQQLGYKTSYQMGKPYHKGRTAKVERYIQTVRRQSAALVCSVELKCNCKFDDFHAIRAWSLCHAGWLLNRFHEHAALKCTPYQVVFGKQYSGKLLPFGEFAYGLRRPNTRKGGNLWSGGLWVGKDASDMDVLLTPTGKFMSPWSPKVAKPPQLSLGVPLPTIQEAPAAEQEHGAGDEAASDPLSLEDGKISRQQSEPSSSSSSSMGVETQLKREGGAVEHTGSPEKQPRRADSSAAVSGAINNVVSHETDDDGWEQELYHQIDEYDVCYDSLLDSSEHGRPPELSPEEMEQVEREAGLAEVQKLQKLGVVELVHRDACAADSKFLDLREVFDWRFREGQWKRRCRIVGREFRAGRSSDAETFSPTSCATSVRLVLCLHLIFGWKVRTFDVKDAFLMATQRENVYVELRPWIRSLLGLDTSYVWKLHRCLPGQRNAATRWFDEISSTLISLGFVACVLSPSLFRHRTRQIALVVHVDDICVASDESEGDWIEKELGSRYELSVSGPVPEGECGNGETLMYLKKTLFVYPRRRGNYLP